MQYPYIIDNFRLKLVNNIGIILTFLTCNAYSTYTFETVVGSERYLIRGLYR